MNQQGCLHRCIGAIAVLAFAMVLSGCGSGPDLDRAKTMVTTALQKWKDKGLPAQLTDMEFADPDWSAGLQLIDFKVNDASAQPQQGPRVVVVLSIKDRAGKIADKEVAYEVMFLEKVKIGRDAFHFSP